ncbi:MAG: penicillin-binding protein activator, partial [Pseudomonadota bacterium]
ADRIFCGDLLKRRMTKTRLLLALLITLGLTSCAVGPPAPDELALAHERAGVLLTQGKRQEAAEIYWQQAQLSSTAAREELQLLALETVLTRQTLQQAQHYRSMLDETRFQGELLVRKRLAEARLALLEDRPEAALAALPSALKDLAPGRTHQIQQLRASALQASGQVLHSTEIRIGLDQQLPDAEAQRANRQAIWQSLQGVEVTQLQQWAQLSTEPVLKGWLELAYIGQTSPDQMADLQRQLNSWQESFPNHPAELIAIPKILAQWQKLQFRPRKIAVILPFSGRYASIAKTLMTGISTAYYADHEHQPNTAVLQTYDLGDQPQNIQRLYEQAVAEGAEVVIGPLQKLALTRLMRMTELPVPVLSLNYASSDMQPPANLYQFGLLPEDEAKQVAERAILDERQYAIVFIPTGSWGTRLAETFTERFETLGGVVLKTERYPPGESDYSAPIRRAMLLDESQQRYRSLQKTLKRKIKFEPYRRQDVDMVFVAAHPRQARLLRPQLRFHYASDLTVYATSHVYSGELDPKADQDLNGVIYCDIPWNLSGLNPRPDLRMSIEESFPDIGRQRPRLMALGLDAYRLLPHLKRLAARPHARYAGLTGNLSSNESRHIYRELNWAQFTKGQPKVLGPPAITDLAGQPLP